MVIYAITTDTYKIKDWYKISMVEDKSMVLSATWSNLPDYVTDTNVRDQLTEMGCHIEGEWFCTDLKEIDEAIQYAIDNTRR